MKRLSVAVSLAALIWACGGGSRSSSPTSPSAPPAPAAPRATYTLSGVVSEMTPTGQVPVQGVRVEESYFHANVTTDANGFYSFSGPYGTGLTNSVSFSKEGYQPDRRDVTINGDTRLDIQVLRRATYTLSGVVSEATAAGQVPVEGVWVSESYFHAGVWTDTDGFYRFSGPYGTGITNIVSFSKDGYQAETSSVAINGDTRLDSQLVRR